MLPSLWRHIRSSDMAATVEELPDAVAAMAPCHVVRLDGDALDRRRRRVQQDLHRQRRPAGSQLDKTRRTGAASS